MQRDRLGTAPPSTTKRYPWLARALVVVVATMCAACGASGVSIAARLHSWLPAASSHARSPVTATPAATVDWPQAPQLDDVPATFDHGKAKYSAITSAKVAPPQACRSAVTDSHEGMQEPRGLHRGDPFRSGEVVLTFDDGPYPDKTPSVLDLLAQHDFSATFFVLGRHITRRSYPLLQRMEREGHSIGSHSYDHDIEMAKRGSSQHAVRYVVAQHRVTAILIQLALLATSPDDFDALYRRVIEADPARRLAQDTLVTGVETMLTRLQSLLAERGFDSVRYRVLYSRPPGGGPYLGRSQRNRQRYHAALTKLGMLNVMWHAQSGDVDDTRARQTRFLVDNITRGARRGGVLLLHDFISPRALSWALTEVARQRSSVLTLDEAVARKYHCSMQLLGRYTL